MGAWLKPRPYTRVGGVGRLRQDAEFEERRQEWLWYRQGREPSTLVRDVPAGSRRYHAGCAGAGQSGLAVCIAET